ncbi:MAG: SH3 domain-containing protein [Candidatus Rifleibacteriota bacterium]
MKKAKLISILVIMIAVVALGVFMGKQMFKLIEAGSSSSVQENSDSNATSTVKILYSAKPDTSDSQIPSPEIIPEKPSQAAATPSQSTSQEKAADNAKTSFSPDGPKWFAYAKGNGINVRQGSSINNKQLFKVAKGTRGTVLAKENGWTQIKWDFNGKTGWVRDDLLLQGPAEVVSTLVRKTGDVEKIKANQINKAVAKRILKENKLIVGLAKEVPAEQTVKKYVEGEKLPEKAKIAADPYANIRTGPGTNNAKIHRLPKGFVVTLLKVEREGKWLWFNIQFDEGRKTGWTREDNLTF